ncbi:Protein DETOXIFICATION [Seminavis robusta]|uniref:Protein DETOXIFICATION n=1 Tax=Seminavis robusta TaxID=568900 RepID=A0A9N8H3I8_9STRA|nr:Protein DETOXIFICATION [Seminavis robusta]|eukprot:Sro61_g035190.1 Protein DETOXIFICATION (770) ;mRNA; f:123245-125649
MPQQRLLVLALLPLSGLAFSSSRTAPRSNARLPSRLVLSTVLLEEESFPNAEKPDELQSTVEGELQVDIGKELFLAGIECVSSETLLTDAAVMPVLMDSGADSLLGSGFDEGPTVPKTEESFEFSLNTTIKSVAELGQEINQQKVTTRNVEAVLAASEDAMIAAEASLPSEVNAELSSYATPASNISDIVTTPTSIDEFVEIVPAAAVVGEPETTKIEAPPVMKILKFAIPAVGVWLCSPLLSLIDTSAVGVLSGTTQQAALNPAVAVTDYAALLIAFLYTATTNLVASAQESDRTLPGKPKTTSAMIGAMQLSTYVGLGLGATLFAFARPLLRAIIGNDALDPAVFAAAMKYVRIRALGMPAAAIIGSAQAGCLGCKDIKSPLYVLLAAAVVNFLGDACFVGCKHPWIGGAAGAAWATVFSQYAALAIFVRWLVQKPKSGNARPKVVDLTKNIMDLMSKDGDKRRKEINNLQSNEVQLPKKESKRRGLGGKINGLFGKKDNDAPAVVKATRNDDTASVRGLLAGRLSGLDLVKLPKKEVAKEFAPYVAPVTVTQIGRVSGYVAMSHVVSSSLGTVSMAAQQVIVSVFYCLCPIADSLSLTAQSFIPGISEKKASKERADALRKTARNFLKAGGVFGAVMAAAIGLLPVMSGFFTGDPAVVSLVNTVVPILVAFFSVHGVMQATEGVLLGQKDLGFLGKMYGAFFVAVPFFMLRVKRAALAGVPGISIASVWSVFLAYQIFRVIVWVARVELIQKATDRAAASLSDLRP